jgi:hypothetical protein
VINKENNNIKWCVSHSVTGRPTNTLTKYTAFNREGLQTFGGSSFGGGKRAIRGGGVGKPPELKYEISSLRLIFPSVFTNVFDFTLCIEF